MESSKTYINTKSLIQRLKGEKVFFGLKSAKKKAKRLIMIYDKYSKILDPKEIESLEDSNLLIRYFDIESLVKLKSILNRNHSINVIGT